MKINEVKDTLKYCLEIGQNVILLGPPGVGKTSVIEQFANELGRRLIRIDAPLVDLLDLKGALTVKDGEAKFTPMSCWPKKDDAPVVVLLDELPQAVPAIQNGFSRLLLNNEIDEMKLPEGSIVIATGNRAEDRAATHKIPSHITNRLMYMNIECSVEAWVDWAIKNGVDERIISLANFKPDIIHNFNPDDAYKPYPTFRSWTAVDKWLKSGVTGSLKYEGISGLVGEAASIMLKAIENTKVPDVDKVLGGDYSELEAIEDASIKYSIAVSLAFKVKKNNIKQFFEAVNKLGSVFSVVALKTLKSKSPELCKGKEFIKWASAHAELVL